MNSIRTKVDFDRPRKAADLIAEQIRNSIATGELKAGELLPPEAQLIKMFNVSRPSIREAVRILESENVVSVNRGAKGGAVVKESTPEQVARTIQFELQRLGSTFGDVYEVRSTLEPVAARMAAERNAAAAAVALSGIVDAEMEGLQEQERRVRAAAQFHRTLLEQTGNVTMTLIASALSQVFEQHLSLVYEDAPAAVPDVQERALIGIKSHRRLIDHIRNGDGAAAELHWRTHMEIVGDLMYNKVGQRPLSHII